jgi:hypothetical protein
MRARSTWADRRSSEGRGSRSAIFCRPSPDLSNHRKQGVRLAHDPASSAYNSVCGATRVRMKVRASPAGRCPATAGHRGRWPRVNLLGTPIGREPAGQRVFSPALTPRARTPTKKPRSRFVIDGRPSDSTQRQDLSRLRSCREASATGRFRLIELRWSRGATLALKLASQLAIAVGLYVCWQGTGRWPR